MPPDLPASEKEPQSGSVQPGFGFPSGAQPSPGQLSDLDPPELIGQAEQRDELDLLKHLNEQRAALWTTWNSTL